MFYYVEQQTQDSKLMPHSIYDLFQALVILLI